ncbi:MAG TPA: polysaccharide biosynthesis protein, partial [Caulobacterales bacterium]|nr:polysaccharide biosynthesis protein [Caulobacterales bacterium]
MADEFSGVKPTRSWLKLQGIRGGEMAVVKAMGKTRFVPPGALLLYGARESISAFIEYLRREPRRLANIAGVIVTDGVGEAEIAGLPVLGARLDERAIAAAPRRVSCVVLCDRNHGREAARAGLAAAVGLGLRTRIVIGNGRTRPLRLPDLLGAPGDDEFAPPQGVIAGKRVLVTGAGGSIGSELCRLLAQRGPARLTLLDSSEFNLYSIDHELASCAPGLARARALCDIRDGDALARWFQRERPDIVFHVAALKHVPMVEEFVCEGVLTNVLGTRNVAQAAAAVGAHMLFVSTDKAANPTGAMGATKRAAEMLCQAFDRAGRARFMIARLGNVLGSTGSVTPMFERQIAAGGPVTVTDPEVARYFITIPQAADFILRALAVGVKARAPRGAALVLDMGDPIPVIELARDMILLHGQRPEEDVEIKIVGLRPGEKLIEQLIDENEAVQFLTDEGMMAAHAAP